MPLVRAVSIALLLGSGLAVEESRGGSCLSHLGWRQLEFLTLKLCDLSVASFQSPRVDPIVDSQILGVRQTVGQQVMT